MQATLQIPAAVEQPRDPEVTAAIRQLVESIDPPSDTAPRRGRYHVRSVRLNGESRLARALDSDRLFVVVVEAGESDAVAESRIRSRFGLTPRQTQVARMLAQRYSSKEIARQLGVTVHTARRHSEAVLQRLGIHRRSDVAAALAAPDERRSRNRREQDWRLSWQ
jgi:DNA-binding CsgD family transcriptional regulator